MAREVSELTNASDRSSITANPITPKNKAVQPFRKTSFRSQSASAFCCVKYPASASWTSGCRESSFGGTANSMENVDFGDDA
jgi:hypothetical protein